MYYRLIIPKVNFQKIYKRGFEEVMDYHNKKGDAKRIICDDYLYSIGAMSPGDMETIGKYWEKEGLQLTEDINGEKHWKDVCVVDFVNGPTLACEWLVFKKNKTGFIGSWAYYKN